MQGSIPAILEAVINHIVARPRYPSRLTSAVHAGFTFRDALQMVPYLHALGITHCYASPFLQAQAGSTHGYDTTNHQALNPDSHGNRVCGPV